MFKMEITGIKDLMKQLDPKLVKKAGRGTINKVVSIANKEIKKAVKKRYNVTKGRINKESVKIFKATERRLEGTIRARGRRVGLAQFGAKALQRSVVGVKVLKRGGIKKIQRGFIQRVRGNMGVHRRVNAKKGHPVELFLKGPSIPQMYRKAGGDKILKKTADKKFEPEFQAQYKKFFDKAKK